MVSVTESAGEGAVTVPDALLVQPLASVTVTVYVPAPRLDKLSVVALPDDHT